MQHYTYYPKNTCSTKIEFDLTSENKITNLQFTNGCSGNLQAISKLLEGKDAKEIVNILSGNRCGFRDTSCADQLCIALKEALNEQ